MNTNHHSTPADIRDPYQVAPDTWVIPELVPGPPGTFVPLNSLVIAGAEPVIVDTGNELSRPQWLEAAFSIVDPDDVRWIFLSHDDHDHSGNLTAVLELCRNATLVTTFFTVERTSRAMELPLDRMRWINPGEQFDAGDRTLVAVRPPIFDSPVTRGLYDSSTGLYWAVDTFAALTPDHLTDVDDIPVDLWTESLLDFNRMISPWHTLVDPAKYAKFVDQVQDLDITTVASGHSPALRGARLEEAFRMIRSIPDLPAVVDAGQADLDELLRSRTVDAA